MIFKRCTLLLIVLISYLQCTSVTSMWRIRDCFKARAAYKKALAAESKAEADTASGKKVGTLEMLEGIACKGLVIEENAIADAEELNSAEIATAQSKPMMDLERLKFASQWKLEQEYLQFPTEGSLNIYRIQPHTSESETTADLVSIAAGATKISKMTSDLFTVAQYIPHQLYRLASEEGNGYLCGFALMNTLTVRKTNDVIYRGQNVWCDWMEIKNPQQNYFAPIAGYSLYEINDGSLDKKIAFRNSMDYADDNTMHILNENTLYITNKVNHWRKKSSWTVEMRSTANLMEDTSFHHALERTRFTPEMIASKGVIVDGAALDVYVFTNTFELKKKVRSNGKERSKCLCVDDGKMVALSCMKDSVICQWIKEEPTEGKNEVVFSSRAHELHKSS